jgi:DNA-binding NtrC family response regulator
MTDAFRRILLVDDDAALLKLMNVFLARMGYEVESFAEAKSALTRFRDGGRFNVTIADLTMNGMSGDELLRTVLQEDARMCGVLCSGYAGVGEELVRDYPGRVEVLLKPFAPRMLARVIDKLEAGER